MLAVFNSLLYNKDMTYIRRAAMIFQGGGMVEGQDYTQILSIAHRFGFTGTYVSGYLTSLGEFIDRNQAKEIAIKAGQLPADFLDKIQPKDLFGSNGYEIN